jgi:hypothetical protein
MPPQVRWKHAEAHESFFGAIVCEDTQCMWGELSVPSGSVMAWQSGWSSPAVSGGVWRARGMDTYVY